MSNWKGYFIKALKTNEIFPNKYIEHTGWESDPNHREEVKAYRDDYTRNLTRVTATGTKSSFSFTTREGLKLEDREFIKDFFDRNISNALERKITLEYWNDEELNYRQGDFYIPNMNFKIKVVGNKTLVYSSYKLEFIEY